MRLSTNENLLNDRCLLTRSKQWELLVGNDQRRCPAKSPGAIRAVRHRYQAQLCLLLESVMLDPRSNMQILIPFKERSSSNGISARGAFYVCSRPTSAYGCDDGRYSFRFVLA